LVLSLAVLWSMSRFRLAADRKEKRVKNPTSILTPFIVLKNN
jgi:hypothetical protein